MEPAAAGILYGVETLLEGAVALAKGVYDPTLPLKATYRHISSVPLPRTGHTISVVNGRAYIFGGESSPDELADNSMHVVILPTTDTEEPDYKSIAAASSSSDGPVPAQRTGHTASVIENQIYIFGGRTAKGEPADSSKGLIWAFDTRTETWSSINPTSNVEAPEHRYAHASVSTDLPRPPIVSTFEGTLPQQPPDASAHVPEPTPPNTFGTLFIHAGQSLASQESSSLLRDLWAFDFHSWTWTALPEAPGLPRSEPSLALVSQSLYRFGGSDGTNALGGQIDHLDLSREPLAYRSPTQDPPHTAPEHKPLSPATPEWQSIFFREPSPPNCAGAGLIPVTTGQGRNYLLLIPTTNTGTSVWSTAAPCTLWTYQLPTAHQRHARPGTDAASAKDAARTTIGKPTEERSWAECKFVDDDGKTLEGGALIGRSIVARSGFAVDSGSEVDGGAAVVWGGVNTDGKVTGDGWVVIVEK